MPRMNREESQAQTRNRLIEAARDEIAKKGFAFASVRDIADAAGYSQGAFYSNFPDKEAILLELVRRHQVEERERIEAALGANNGGATSALAGIEKWATADNADPGFSVLAIELQLQALRSPKFAEAYNALSRAHRQKLGALIAKLFGLLGKEVPGDPVEIATGFMALSRGMALLSSDETIRRGRVVLTFLQALVEAAPPIGPHT